MAAPKATFCEEFRGKLIDKITDKLGELKVNGPNAQHGGVGQTMAGMPGAVSYPYGTLQLQPSYGAHQTPAASTSQQNLLPAFGTVPSATSQTMSGSAMGSPPVQHQQLPGSPPMAHLNFTQPSQAVQPPGTQQAPGSPPVHHTQPVIPGQPMMLQQPTTISSTAPLSQTSTNGQAHMQSNGLAPGYGQCSPPAVTSAISSTTPGSQYGTMYTPATTSSNPDKYHPGVAAAQHNITQTAAAYDPSAQMPQSYSIPQQSSNNPTGAYGTYVAPAMLANQNGLQDLSSFEGPSINGSQSTMQQPAPPVSYANTHDQYGTQQTMDSNVHNHCDMSLIAGQIGTELQAPMMNINGAQISPSMQDPAYGMAQGMNGSTSGVVFQGMTVPSNQPTVGLNTIGQGYPSPPSRPNSAMGYGSNGLVEPSYHQGHSISRPHSSQGVHQSPQTANAQGIGWIHDLASSVMDPHQAEYFQQLQGQSAGVLQATTTSQGQHPTHSPGPLPPPGTWMPDKGRRTKDPWTAPNVNSVAYGDMQANQALIQFLMRHANLSPHGNQFDVQNALVRFQDSVELPKTGRYDEATARSMEMPRCDGASAPAMGGQFSGSAQGEQDRGQSVIIDARERFRFKLFGPRWPHLGKPTITWRIINTSTDLPEARMRSDLVSAFAVWLPHVPFNFIEVPRTSSADISISFQTGAHGDPQRLVNGVDQNVLDGASTRLLAHAFAPGPAAIDGDIHFDDDNRWDLAKTDRSSFFSVAVHEIGHSLGLDHSDFSTNIMNQVAGTVVASRDDIDGVTALYGPFRPVVESFTGLAGFDPRQDSSREQCFALDFDASGKMDHLMFFRPGNGFFSVVKHNRDRGFGQFLRIFSGTAGIGAFDLKNPNDRGFAFDFTNSGKMDHWVFYRPGTGFISIFAGLKPTSAVRSRLVFSSTTGIGGFDLRNPADRLIAFDFAHTGRNNSLIGYRPGTGFATIISNNFGTFRSTQTFTNGFPSFDLRNPADQLHAVDLEATGRLDHLIGFRPGSGLFVPLNHDRTNIQLFNPVLPDRNRAPNIALGNGFPGFDLRSPDDRILALPGSRIILYRPGTGLVATIHGESQILPDGRVRQFHTEFLSDPATGGMAGWDCRGRSDTLVAFDMSQRGKPSDLVMIRPGTGFVKVWLNMSVVRFV